MLAYRYRHLPLFQAVIRGWRLGSAIALGGFFRSRRRRLFSPNGWWLGIMLFQVAGIDHPLLSPHIHRGLGVHV